MFHQLHQDTLLLLFFRYVPKFQRCKVQFGWVGLFFVVKKCLLMENLDFLLVCLKKQYFLFWLCQNNRLFPGVKTAKYFQTLLSEYGRQVQFQQRYFPNGRLLVLTVNFLLSLLVAVLFQFLLLFCLFHVAVQWPLSIVLTVIGEFKNVYP